MTRLESPGFDVLVKQLSIRGILLTASGNPQIFSVNCGTDDTLSQIKEKWLNLIKQHPTIKEVFLIESSKYSRRVLCYWT